MKDFNGKVAFITGGTSRLNELKVPSPEMMLRSPKIVVNIVNRECYTGEVEYNVHGCFPNPNKPLGYMTLTIKRTLLSPKPKEERVK